MPPPKPSPRKPLERNSKAPRNGAFYFAIHMKFHQPWLPRSTESRWLQAAIKNRHASSPMPPMPDATWRKRYRLALSAALLAASAAGLKALAYPFSHPELDEASAFQAIYFGSSFALACAAGAKAMAQRAFALASPASFNALQSLESAGLALAEINDYLRRANELRRPITVEEAQALQRHADAPAQGPRIGHHRKKAIQLLLEPSARATPQTHSPPPAGSAAQTLLAIGSPKSLELAELHNDRARAHLESLSASHPEAPG